MMLAAQSTRLSRTTLILVCALSLLGLSVLIPLWEAQRVYAQGGCGANNVGGVVYRDYNENGTRDALEPGVPGLTITAYDPAGTALAAAATSAIGDYVLNVPNGVQVRIEFDPILAGFLSGPFGGDSATTVTFVQSPNCAVDLGINRPGQYCQSNPELATSCYASGDQATVTDPVFVAFPYSATGIVSVNAYPATGQQIGTTWGLAHQRASNSYFVAAFMKRHSGFGPGGPGAIYRVDRNTNAVTLFLDLNSPAYFGPGAAGLDPHPGGTNFTFDSNGWDPVGKIAFGDMDMGEDDQTLWAINLADRQLYEIPIGLVPAAPPVASIGRFPIPFPADCPTPLVNLRPFALGVQDGRVFVGSVCSAESTQNRGDLRGYVDAFDPASDTFTQVLNFPLDYVRGCAVQMCSGGAGGNGDADWLPWINTFTVNPTIYSGPPDNLYVYPQPWITDVTFDNGDMILGLRDRFGDQMGYQERNTNAADPLLYSGAAAGELLRACANGAGGWVLESNGTCGPVTTLGAGNGQGPGGGEYYFQENFAPDHEETSLGGLVQIPGFPDVAQTVYDPFVIYEGGVLWSSNAAGARARAYRVFEQTGAPLAYGKAGGLGDLEAACDPSPIEIGNRVWLDTVSTNGVQDAGEVPVAGVTVRLYSGLGVLLATTTTNAAGEYYFNNTNVPGGLQPFTAYEIRLDDPANYASGGPLFGLLLTLANQSADLRDSDGALAGGFPVVALTTGGADSNDHTFDFGFASQVSTSTPTPMQTQTGTPPTPAPTPTLTLTSPPGTTATASTPSISTPPATFTPATPPASLPESGAGPGWRETLITLGIIVFIMLLPLAARQVRKWQGEKRQAP